MNTHVFIPAPSVPSFELEEEICHLEREARAAQMMADELLSLLRNMTGPEFTGPGIAALTAEAQEMLEDFAGRVARGARGLRIRYYAGVR